MALDFPLNPTIGQKYISGNFSYIWTGSKWKLENRKYKIVKESLTNSVNTTAVNLSLGNIFTLNLSDKTNITFTNPPAAGKSQRFFIKLGINNDYTDAGDNTSYVIGTGTAYDNASYLIPYEVRGIRFGDNGFKVFLVFNDASAGQIRQYNLTAAYDLSTANFSTPASTISVNNSLTFDLKSDGTVVYITNTTTNVISAYTLPTPWVLTGAVLLNSYTVAEVTNIWGMRFGNSGKNLYIIGNSSNIVRQYNLTTAWNISTMAAGTTYSTSAQIASNLSDVDFNSTGTAMILVGFGNNTVFKYNLSSAWNILTTTYISGNAFSVSTQATLAKSIQFNGNGSKMYISDDTNNRIYQYTTGGTATTNTIPTVTWPTNLKWENGTTPKLPDLTQSDLLEFYTYDGGVTYYGKVVIDNIK